MKFVRFARAAALVAAMAVSTSAHAQESAALNEALSFDGLQKTNIKGIELAYVRPGVTLADYTSVQLAPVYVAFAKDWTATAAPGSPFAVSAYKVNEVKQQVATLVHKAFVKEIQTKGGFPIVSASGPHVLLVKINIVNLNIVAPLQQSASMSATWTSTSGSATLYAELFDSETGQVIARIVDAQAVDNNGQNSYYMNNMANAQWIAEAWAKKLVDGLDKARAQLATAAPAAAAP
jgi:hypothetical protein